MYRPRVYRETFFHGSEGPIRMPAAATSAPDEGIIGTMRRFDWLIVLIVSWLLPLGFVPFVKVTYFSSLLFWLVPIACLIPRFLHLTHTGSRRRRALCWATAQIVFMGMLLDLVFGHK